MSERDPMSIAISLLFIAIGVAVATQIDGNVRVAITVAVVPLIVLGIMILSAGERPAPPPNDERNHPAISNTMVLDAVRDPMLIVANGRVQHGNAPAIALLGAHIIGQDLRLAIRHPALADVENGGTVELNNVGGRGLRLSLTATVLADGRRLLHIVDRTERLLVEQARVDFVANASHELRTPLAAILGYVETLSDDKAGGDTAVRNRFLSIVMAEARRMQQLVEELITLSRIEAEKHALPETEIDLATLVRDVADGWRGDDGRPRENVVLDLHDGVPPIHGDSTQLKQVINNLAGNAFRYGRPPVTISLTSDATHVRLSVADQGEGIAPEHLPRLTERFYRVDAGRSRALGGTGLGLSIVKHIVERHRGRLDIRSKQGVGTIITVILPTAAGVIVTNQTPN